MFRLVDAVGGTLLMDEADFSRSEVGADIAKILNVGYQKNSPIIRMEEGEDGKLAPRPFQPFGPKIINGRRPFRDESTESRCLVYQPSATSRADIPTQLPAAFEQEAGEIRNRAMAWRLDVLDSFAIVDRHLPGLRPRTNQIVLPLLSVAQHMSDSAREPYVDALLRFAHERDSQSQEMIQDTIEADLVRGYLALKEAGTCKGIRNWVLTKAGRDDSNLERWMTAQWVGRKMRELGFATPHTKRGTVPTIEAKRLADLQDRFGIVVTAASPGPSPGTP